MKTETLKEKGLTEEQIAFVMQENGKDIKKLQKENEKLQAERDDLRAKKETAEETLEKFEGIDPEQIKVELETYKNKAKEAEEEYNKKLYDRDFNDALKNELEEVKFTSAFAKKAIIEDIKKSGLKLKNGKILGLNDYLDQIKEEDQSAFVNEDKEHLEANAARFTDKHKNYAGTTTMTRKEIMGIKDSSKRQSEIAKHLSLFGKDQ